MWVDPRSSAAIFNSVSNIVEEPSPIAIAKSIKNDIEINGMKQCHIRDAAALVYFILFQYTLYLFIYCFILDSIFRLVGGRIREGKYNSH